MMDLFVMVMILVQPNGALVAMPANPAKPTDIVECGEIGTAATLFALQIADPATGLVNVTYPDGTKRPATPVGFDCVPVEWMDQNEEND